MRKRQPHSRATILIIGLILLLGLSLNISKAQGQENAIEYKPISVHKDSASLYVLNKTTGVVKKISIPVGHKKAVDNIHIMVQTCQIQITHEGREEAVFLTIDEDTVKQTAGGKRLSATTKDVQETKEIFSGWMFAQRPALSTLENKNYDLWLEHCQ